MASSQIYDERLQTLLGERGKDTGDAAVRKKDLEALVLEIIKSSGTLTGAVSIVDVTGSRAITSSDIGCVLRVTSNADVTLSLPADLKEGFSTLAVRAGAGEVIFSAQGNSALRSFVPGHSRIAARWGIATLLCLSRPVNDKALWLLSGNTI